MKTACGPVFMLILAACSSPSPQFMGITPSEQIISGVRFDVYQRQNQVQVIRLSGKLPGGLPGIKAAAIRAIENATACNVIADTLSGDMEVIKAQVDCGT